MYWSTRTSAAGQGNIISNAGFIRERTAIAPKRVSATLKCGKNRIQLCLRKQNEITPSPCCPLASVTLRLAKFRHRFNQQHPSSAGKAEFQGLSFARGQGRRLSDGRLF